MEERLFVESLSDPCNIHRLALEGWFSDKDFVSYLGVLDERWSRPAWYRTLRYPAGAFFLTQLARDAAFRQRAVEVGFVSEVSELADLDRRVVQ